jgi:ABC-type transporter Mla subunit MlaD
MSETGPSAHATRLVLLVGFGLLVLGLLAVAAVTFARSDQQPEPALTASPVPGVTQAESPVAE